jgi:hypothetical protein
MIFRIRLIYIIKMSTSVKNNINQQRNNWLIKVRDGIDFMNSTKNIWGFHIRMKEKVLRMKQGDILIFYKNKCDGGEILAFATYVKHFDVNDERILNVNIHTNKELGFSYVKESDTYGLQIHYENNYILSVNPLTKNIKSPEFHCNLIEKVDEQKMKQELRECFECYKTFIYNEDIKRKIDEEERRKLIIVDPKVVPNDQQQHNPNEELREKLNKHRKDYLVITCRQFKLKGYSTLNKKKLIEFLIKNVSKEKFAKRID